VSVFTAYSALAAAPASGNGGLIVIHNVLWRGRLAAMRARSRLHVMNDKLHRDNSIDLASLPLGDGADTGAQTLSR
jgi:predicted O-methyltransferase YrrM